MPPMIDWGTSGTTTAAPAAPAYQPPKPPQEEKFPNIPKGTVLTVKVVPGGVAIEQLKYANKKNPEITTKVSFHFVVTEGEWEKRHIWGSTQPTFEFDNPKCYLRLWLQALLGVDEWPEGHAPAETTEVNKRGETIRVMHDFDNLPAKVLVGNWTTNDGQTRFGVDDVTPIGAQDAAELY